MAIRMILLLFLSFSALADQKVYMFGESETEFVLGSFSEYAADKGVEFVFYKKNEREEILKYLSLNLGGEEEQARKILAERIQNNPQVIDRLVHAVEGEHKALKFQIKKQPAVLIDGKVFYTQKVDEALEALK